LPAGSHGARLTKVKSLQAKSLRFFGIATWAFVVYVIGVGLTNIAIGRNWGYIGRMEASAIPIAVIIVACVFKGFPWVPRKGNSASLSAVFLAGVLIVGMIQSDFGFLFLRPRL
jgi:hypothetical protein